MAAISDLEQLLKTMTPVLSNEHYVFCQLGNSKLIEFVGLNPLASFVEEEGLTLVLDKDTADKHGLKYAAQFKKISLQVHSSLTAVGLTAAISTALAKQEISANIIAAYYHDHIFVPFEVADLALNTLKKLTLED